MKTLKALSIEMDFFFIIVFSFCFKIQQLSSQGSTERELVGERPLFFDITLSGGVGTPPKMSLACSCPDPGTRH